MSIFTTIANVFRIRRSGPNPALADTAPTWKFYGRPYAGLSVTDDTALSLTAVYRCIVLIATTAAGQPIHVHEEKVDGSSERIKPDNLRYLWDRPNPEMTKQTFWEIVIGHEVMGDAFIFVVKNRADQPLELWPIEPRRVKVGRTGDGRKVYQVDEEIPMIDFMAGGEIIHVPNWGTDGLRGISPIKAAAVALSLGISAQEYAERYFGQSSLPDGVLSTDKDLTVEQSEALAQRWHDLHSGLANIHKVAVLGSGAKFQAISVTPEDSQLIEERRFQVEEIARLFGVPPHMLGDTERSTSWGTGIEEQTRGFVVFTLQAHINRFEQAVNDVLLRRSETDRFFKFDLRGLLRGTTLQRYQAYAIGYGRWFTTNEIRQLEDLPAVPGGDEVLAAQNLVPLDDLELMQAESQPASMPAGGPPGGAPPSRNGNGVRA